MFDSLVEAVRLHAVQLDAEEARLLLVVALGC